MGHYITLHYFLVGPVSFANLDQDKLRSFSVLECMCYFSLHGSTVFLVNQEGSSVYLLETYARWRVGTVQWDKGVCVCAIPAPSGL